MFLGINNGVKRLILVLPLFFMSSLVYSAPHCIAFATISKNSCYLKGNCPESYDKSYINTKCDLSLLSGGERYICGNKSKETNRVVVRADKTGITTHHLWYEPGTFHDGYFYWDEQINFKAPAEFAGTIFSAFKKALEQNNCTAAKDLAEGLNNGQRCEADSSAYCFSRENADGSRNACVVKSDGSSRCKVQTGQTEETNPDGTPRIKIDCAAGEDCRKDTDLDGYANLPDTKTDDGDSGSTDDGKIKEHRGEGGSTGEQGGDGKHNEGDKGISGGSGSSGPDKHGNTSDDTGKVGSGMANNGKSPDTKTENDSDKQGGQDNSNTDKIGDSNVKDSDKDGNGKGSSGDGNGSGGGGGSGAGNGQGDGEGDGKDGDGKDEKDTEAVDLFEAPSMGEAFAPLQKVLKDKFSPNIEIDGGDCPKPQFTLMGKSFTVSAHCDILAQLAEYFSSLMMFLYTFTAIRILLSA